MIYSKLSDKANASLHLKKAAALAPNSQTAKDAQKELSVSAKFETQHRKWSMSRDTQPNAMQYLGSWPF